MQLKVLRQEFSDDSTIGQLMVDGRFECYTLEDRVRPEKIYGETAIPTGTYRVVVTFSPAFKRRLPLLVDVPGYTGVRIHAGNTKKDTLGCLLVGQSKSRDFIGASRAAFDALMPKIEAAAQSEEVLIEVVNEGTPPGMPATRSRSRGAPAAAEVRLGAPWMPPATPPAPAKKRAAKKKRVKKAAVKKAVSKKPAAKKSAAKKAPAKKAAAKKAAAKKAAVRKSTTRERARKTAPRKRAAK